MYEIALTGNLQGTVTGTGTLQILCACFTKQLLTTVLPSKQLGCPSNHAPNASYTAETLIAYTAVYINQYRSILATVFNMNYTACLYKRCYHCHYPFIYVVMLTVDPFTHLGRQR